MKKFLKAQAAALIAVVVTLALGAAVLSAAGLPQAITITSPNAQNGVQILPAGSPTTPHWFDRVIFDQAYGASNTVQVQFYDVAPGGVTTAANLIGTLTLCTSTAAITSAANGAQTVLMNGANDQVFDAYLVNGLFIATAQGNPDTVTAEVVVGQRSDAALSVKR